MQQLVSWYVAALSYAIYVCICGAGKLQMRFGAFGVSDEWAAVDYGIGYISGCLILFNS